MIPAALAGLSTAQSALLGLAVVGLLTGGSWLHGCQYGSSRATAAAEAQEAAELAEARALPEAPEPRTLIKEVVRHVPVGEACRCPDFADDFGVRWNTIAAGP